MENNKSNCFSLILCSCLLILIVYPNLGCLAARKLLDEDAAPSPRNNVTYESDTRNGAHGGITYVNGEPRSQSGIVRTPNGDPVVQANNHTGSQEGFINNPNGTPQVVARNTSGGQAGTIYGNDGKPQIEAHSYDNGTQSVTFYGSDGKPYTINYQTPPGSPFAP
ncbi:hypothetical protein M5689_016948 [Euphorbia peplus]|nr:hypothetical protein M5689_016948 [Euphorbia peplus]